MEIIIMEIIIVFFFLFILFYFFFKSGAAGESSIQAVAFLDLLVLSINKSMSIFL